MKESKQCPKCGGIRIGHLPKLNGSTQPELRSKTRQAHLDAYVCTDCGYLEHYLADPKMLNFDELSNFRWLNPPIDSDGPYR